MDDRDIVAEHVANMPREEITLEEVAEEYKEAAEKLGETQPILIKKEEKNKELIADTKKKYADLLKIIKAGVELTAEQKFNKNLCEDFLRDVGELEEDLVIEKAELFENCDPEDFFEDKKFISKCLGDFIMNEIRFKTFGGATYYYKNGVYLDKGEEVIETLVNKALKDMFRKHYAEETKFYIKTSTYIEHNDPEKHVINLQNGLFDLKEKELKPHDPDLFLVSQLPITYNIDANCPKIKEFIGQIVVGDDIKNLQEFVGYCLWKDYHIQKAFMLIGEGANGKTTFTSLLKTFLGQENVNSTTLQNLDKSRFAVAGFHGKLANICSELDDSALQRTGNFKALTGGDIITAEKKFGSEFRFVNYAKMIFCCNKLPESRDDASAYFRRWIPINFPNKFEGTEDNKNLINELTTESELSGLFNWALEGLDTLLENGRFSNTKATEEIKDQMQRLASPVVAFVLDCVEQSSPDKILKRDLYQAYKDYCKDHNLPLVQENSFAKRLLAVKELRLEEVRVGVKTAWAGIKLKDNISDIRGIDDYTVKNDSRDKLVGDV